MKMAKINISIRNILLVILVAIPMIAAAQGDRDLIRLGNKAYRTKQYAQSEVMYRKALSANHSNTQAMYNLGCALMMQNKMQEAVKYLQMAGEKEKVKMRKAMAYHNIGIICQSGKMYAEAINAYEESLRNNPHDNQTRYNLALCKKLLKNNKDNQNKNNEKNKQNNKDNKQDKNKNQQQQQDKDDKQQGDKPKEQSPHMSKDNAEQLLNAAMQQEQQTQQRLNKSMQQQQTRRLEKNW